MESNLIKIATRIATPLSLASAIIMVLYLLYRLVLGLDIFTTLAENNTFLLLNSIVDKVFILAVIGLVLGIGSYSLQHYLPPKKHDVAETHPGATPVPKGYRRFSVFVFYKNAINRISQADLPANVTWGQASNGFCVGFDAPQNPEEYKTLDVKQGVWLPTPSTVAKLKTDTIALVHVDVANSYSNDAATIAAILRVKGQNY